jgi:uncharacterized membrane protein YgcG
MRRAGRGVRCRGARALAQALAPEDVQLYYQIALGGRRDLAMAPEPRLGFEMTLLRMLAFRPEPGRARRPVPSAAPERTAGGRAGAAGRAAPHGTARRRPPPPGAACTAAAAAPVRPVPAGDRNDRCGQLAGPVDAAQLTGMVRQFALNCVPASFDGGVLSLRSTPRRGSAHAQIEEKLAAGPVEAYLGREIRLNIETAEPASRRRRASGRSRSRTGSSGGGGVRGGSGGQGAARALRRRDRHCIGQTGELGGAIHDEGRNRQPDAPGAADAGDDAEGAGGTRDLEVVGEAGAGMVKVVLNGRTKRRA